MSFLGKKAFRLNYDIFNEYDVSISPKQWKITNPSGHSIDSEISTSAFWWKPFNYGIQFDKYISAEVRYVFKELYAWHLRRGITKGNPPDYHNKFGKIYFLDIASRYFAIPESFVGWGFGDKFKISKRPNSVAKSLASEPTSDDKALYTTEVDVQKLDPNYPWFIQDKVDASHDITVFVCGEKKFCFEKSREMLKSIDWRLEINTDTTLFDEWTRVDFSVDEQNALNKFCIDAKINWGRIDFMRSKTGQLFFLEFNANGQWVFLDYERKHRLVEEVCEYLLD